jgi:hypothetical protein
VQTTLFGSRTHEKKDFYDNPKNNYEIFANKIANEMSGNASRADIKLEIDRRWKTEKKTFLPDNSHLYVPVYPQLVIEVFNT